MTIRAVTAIFVFALAALVLGGDGYAASERERTLIAQRGGHFGGRGGRGQASAGIRTLVTGRITAVDATQNHITLAIGAASVQVEFPPAVVAAAKPGDQVMVTVELIDTRVGTVTGPVTAVDPASGAVTVSLPGGPWTNTFLPADIGAIKLGDQAVLKLDLIDLGPTVAPPSLLPGPSQPSPKEGGTR